MGSFWGAAALTFSSTEMLAILLQFGDKYFGAQSIWPYVIYFCDKNWVLCCNSLNLDHDVYPKSPRGDKASLLGLPGQGRRRLVLYFTSRGRSAFSFKKCY